MAFTTIFAHAVLGLAALTSTEAHTPKDLSLAQGQPYIGSQGYVAPVAGNYMTTADGCTYRRTQAPGYPPRWVLVVNPQHLGKEPATRKCRGMM